MKKSKIILCIILCIILILVLLVCYFRKRPYKRHNNTLITVNTEYIQIEDIETEVTLKECSMQDNNIKLCVVLKFDDSIKEKINLEKVNDITLRGLIIKNDEDKILFGGSSPETFEQYCLENDLKYEFGKWSENYINVGVNSYIENKKENEIEVVYNIYTENATFPESKKLNLYLKTIRLVVDELNIDEMKIENHIECDLKCDWDYNVDL